MFPGRWKWDRLSVFCWLGWIGSLLDHEICELSHHLPGRVRIVFSDTRVIWSAKQSIIRVEREGGAYGRVSRMTPVKDLIVVCDRVFGAGEQIGEVLRW